MHTEQTSPEATDGALTQHAMLVAWGIYAQHIGLIKQLEQVRVKQKQRDHRPQTKVLEFLVAMRAGLAHLKDISQAAHPLDQDVATAEAWGQPAWADHSGVSRPLKSLDAPEVEAIAAVLGEISQPVIDQEVELALAQSGRLIYDADLTGRPVSNTSISYPQAAFGYMGDTVSLGYQAALVTLHSPPYGRLWLVNHLHPGDTVSSTQAPAMGQAAEVRTGLRPRRRTHLLAARLAQTEAAWRLAEERYEESRTKWVEAAGKVKETMRTLAEWRQEVAGLEAAYQRSGRQPTAQGMLTRARRKVTTLENRLLRTQAQLARAQRRRHRHETAADALQAQVTHLRSHLAALEAENRTNPAPIQAVFRLAGGFASQANIAWLIKMGYDLYTKSHSPKGRDRRAGEATDASAWQQVGGNPKLTAWADTTVEENLTYPMNVALAHYQTGQTQRRSVLLHYGQDPVTQHLAEWFHFYNARQTIKAGIKQGKGVFQMHHLKVRSPHALLLQEHCACFAANFVRCAAHWLIQQPSHPPPMQTTSVKHMVQVSAHTSAWVRKQGDVWLLTFTEQSL